MLPSRSGRRECWSAVTTDKAWSFERQEMPGTPWAVVSAETGIVVDSCVGTLTDCRAYVASGQAQADLDLIRAHLLGKHENERSRSCPRC
jgi:hypothetical protein